ncbi:hypothetical protein NE857_05655 [Nocardiopsis exhalans]|uniref:Uncharacterized protein n=1 Tax=Nocardiopsis exhalans TaxID=163604 RepID=A0ABY5DAT0_9ACTN|nr:hypothetical protein [Nocardiopsis exhalans]USY21127.1 hypothetical protein NE857_05655 [Nocardiopsis exhalans]
MTAVRMYYRDDDRVDIVEGERIRSVPLEAVATRLELLGYTDPADGLAACLAEMDQVEDDDSHPYDQVYETYLPYLRRERGYRDVEEPESAAAQGGPGRTGALSAGPSADGQFSAGSGAAAESPLAAALDEARRRARTQLGAPEPGAGRSAAATVSGISAVSRSGTASPSAEETASHQEVLTRLRNEPLIAELRAEFRDQLVPPMEPRGSA